MAIKKGPVAVLLSAMVALLAWLYLTEQWVLLGGAATFWLLIVAGSLASR